VSAALPILFAHPGLAALAAAQLVALVLAVRLCRGGGRGGDEAVAVLAA
jgi:uncharacterized membrane protein YbhN (UPF0104 family)